MEAQTEDHSYCELFFTKINRMLKDASFEIFNPIVIQCDEHGSAKIGLREVYGDEFVNTRTSGCEYHLQKSVDKHKKYFNEEDGFNFNILVNALKNSVTEEAYTREKSKLENLILKQSQNCQKSLFDMLRFWDSARYRWASAFKKNLHNCTRSSLAEAAQASMKAGGEKNLSLVDAVYSDISDSARLEAKWLNRIEGERCAGAGPTPLQLESRNERRQVGRANRFVTELAENEEYQEHNDNDPEETHLESSQPPKAKKRRLKSLESKYFQEILKKSKALKEKLCITEMKKTTNNIIVAVKQSHTVRQVEINLEEIACDCSQSQLAAKKTCHHIVWLFLNLFKISENDQLIAQTEIGAASLQRLMQLMPDIIPDNLLQPRVTERDFSRRLKEHAKFNKEQTWYLSRKTVTKASRCSGCLKPRKIITGDLHFYVDGLLHLEKDDKIVETKLRFCLQSSCVRDIRSHLNNIRPMAINALILKDPSLNGVTAQELKTLSSFNIENVENIPILP